MSLSRRAFLKFAGALLAVAAVLRAWKVKPQTNQAQKTDMEIKRTGSQPSAKGPVDWFTGTVRIDPLFDAKAPRSRIAGLIRVTV